jgi:hypothetical protein
MISRRCHRILARESYAARFGMNTGCYVAELEVHHKAIGTACMRVVLDGNGTVTSTEAPWPFLSEEFLDCALAAVARVRFPSSSSHGRREVRVNILATP